MKLSINQSCTILVPCNDTIVRSCYYHVVQLLDAIPIVLDKFTFHVCYIIVKTNDDLVRLESNSFTQVNVKDPLFNQKKKAMEFQFYQRQMMA